MLAFRTLINAKSVKLQDKGKAGSKREFTLFLIDVIKYSEHQNPACNSAEIINNIIPYFEKNEEHYMSLIIIAIKAQDQRDIEKRQS